MKQMSRGAYLLSVGLAMFSMFFGAGNLVYPFLVGIESQGHILAAIFGLCCTAVGVPLLGLYAMTFFNGEYRPFFDRAGKVLGFSILLILMAILGPFGAIPRCIALSYSTCVLFVPSISATVFSLISVMVIYLFTVKKSKVIDLLGFWLTPALLISLFVIIVRGVFFENPGEVVPEITPQEAFLSGLRTGYHTLDLIGAFFFSHFVVNALKKISLKDGHIHQRLLVHNTLIASGIALFLLGAVYSGLCFIASKHSQVLIGVPADQALGVLSNHFLGSVGSSFTCVAVILACLTTAIALAAVFSEFLHKDLTMSKISYKSSLVFSLVISFYIATLEFNGISRLLGPLVQVIYPSLMVLSVLNIISYQFHWPIGTKATFFFVIVTALMSLMI